MPYRVLPDGTIEADTLDEVIALSARLRSSKHGDNAQSRNGDGVEHTARKVRNPSTLERTKLAFQALADHSQGLVSEELAKAVGLESPAKLAGLLNSMRAEMRGAKNPAAAKKILRKEKDGPLGPTRWFADKDRLRDAGLPCMG
jgi:hypothetical protein